MPVNPGEPEVAQVFKRWFEAGGGRFDPRVHYTPGTARPSSVRFDIMQTIFSELWLRNNNIGSTAARCHCCVVPFLSRYHTGRVAERPLAAAGRRSCTGRLE